MSFGVTSVSMTPAAMTLEVGGDAVTIPRQKYRALQVLARDALRFEDEGGE